MIRAKTSCLCFPHAPLSGKGIFRFRLSWFCCCKDGLILIETWFEKSKEKQLFPGIKGVCVDRTATQALLKLLLIFAPLTMGGN